MVIVLMVNGIGSDNDVDDGGDSDEFYDQSDNASEDCDDTEY